MKTKLKLGLFSLSAAMLTACGGGGGGNSGAGSDTNPLKKYEGTYYVCDGHSKETVTVTASGSNSMSMTLVADLYQNTNCAGVVVGTYKLAQPLIATHQNQTSANLPPVTIFASSDSVDRLSLSYAGGTSQLTGSGVIGNCVNYSGGNTCYDNLTQPVQTATGAAYLNGNYFVSFSLTNGVLAYDAIRSKDPLFNINMLIRK